ncbi:MAG: hypothetical protein M5U14_09485 [Acidimicrobiia bacterium]|nr:hypothetical protein [Acidimicrobiia bacterium]
MAAWLEEALADRRKSWFVVDLFKFQQVPKRLAAAMLRAAVLIQDPSMNRYYLKPLVRSFGIQRVRKEILRYFEEGTDVERPELRTRFAGLDMSHKANATCSANLSSTQTCRSAVT